MPYRQILSQILSELEEKNLWCESGRKPSRFFKTLFHSWCPPFKRLVRLPFIHCSQWPSLFTTKIAAGLFIRLITKRGSALSPLQQLLTENCII